MSTLMLAIHTTIISAALGWIGGLAVAAANGWRLRYAVMGATVGALLALVFMSLMEVA